MRIYQNQPEQKFTELAKSKGWYFTKRGWPDFLCIKDGELIAVEVKPTKELRLKDSQLKAMQLFTKYGIKCYVSDGERLEDFDENKHCSKRSEKVKQPTYTKEELAQLVNELSGKNL